MLAIFAAFRVDLVLRADDAVYASSRLCLEMLPRCA
jgi:hypothetical protein